MSFKWSVENYCEKYKPKTLMLRGVRDSKHFLERFFFYSSSLTFIQGSTFSETGLWPSVIPPDIKCCIKSLATVDY